MVRVHTGKECHVCGTKKVSDSHHIVPIEYGGAESGKQVPLCPTCHRHVHKEGEYYVRHGRWGEYVNENNYPDLGQLSRAKLLAHYIAESIKRFRSTGKAKADDSRNIIQVSLTVDELALTHDLKRKLGFKSLERLMKHLIFEKWEALKKK